MLDTHKVGEELQKLFREIQMDPEVDVINAEDIAPGWEARIVGFRLVKGKDSTEMVARIYNDVDAGSVAEREFNVMHGLSRRNGDQKLRPVDPPADRLIVVEERQIPHEAERARLASRREPPFGD